MKKDKLHQNENVKQTVESRTSAQQELLEGMTEDERIDMVAAQVLERYRAALEELAK